MKFLYIIILSLLSSPLLAQPIWSFNYNIAGLSESKLNDFISRTSTRGWSLEGRGMINQQLSIGGYIGYQGFYEKVPRQTYFQDNTAIDAVTWRYFLTLPIQANAHYYFTTDGIRPFAGVGIGTYYTEQEIQFSNLLVSEKKWNFGFSPEIGILIPFGISDWSAMINAKYHYAIYNTSKFDANNIGYWNVGIGITYTPYF